MHRLLRREPRLTPAGELPFLPADALRSYLRRTLATAVRQGSLPAVVLTGTRSATHLTPLLQSYLDRTADLQVLF